jgi:hypothetical protein
MSRNGCRLWKAETNQEIFPVSRSMAEIERQLQHLKSHVQRNSREQSARPQICAGTKSNLAATNDPHRSNPKRKTYGVALRGKSRVAYHGNRPAGNHPRPWLAHPNPARELAYLLARGALIGRIAPGHYFRGGQLLVGVLRTLRAVMRILEVAHPNHRMSGKGAVVSSRPLLELPKRGRLNRSNHPPAAGSVIVCGLAGAPELSHRARSRSLCQRRPGRSGAGSLASQFSAIQDRGGLL